MSSNAGRVVVRPPNGNRGGGESTGKDREVIGLKAFCLKPLQAWKKKRTVEQTRISRKQDSYPICQGQLPTARVYGIYKPKAKKVRPVDQPDPTGVAPGGIMDWERTIEKELPAKPYSGNYAKWLIPKFSDIKKRSRLTPERAERMRIGQGLTKEEKDLLLEVFYNREAVLA